MASSHGLPCSSVLELSQLEPAVPPFDVLSPPIISNQLLILPSRFRSRSFISDFFLEPRFSSYSMPVHVECSLDSTLAKNIGFGGLSHSFKLSTTSATSTLQRVFHGKTANRNAQRFPDSVRIDARHNPLSLRERVSIRESLSHSYCG